MRSASFIDFKIPLWGVIVLSIGLAGQTGGLIWWGGKLDARVQQLEMRAAEDGKLAVTVARVDERTQALVQTVNRIESRIADREQGR
jgi:hypothetical protein